VGRFFLFVGFGYDVHRLQAGRRLVLGGVEIDFEQGLLGHSDADVLIHAVMDALLGAAGLGDIGEIFPDTDEKFAGACSLDLLRRVGDLLYNSGLRVNNIDCTVVAERPKIAQYKRQMAANIAEVLGIPPTRVNVKATTEEGLGLAGAGIGTYAVATLLRMENGEWRIRDGGYG
jgi:2-C-methyl-D-erythritol 2,4-cyclodiphosphate synthase